MSTTMYRVVVPLLYRTVKFLNKLPSFSDLYGSNSIEAAKIDMILDTVQEFMDTMALVKHAAEETKVSVNDGILEFNGFFSAF